MEIEIRDKAREPLAGVYEMGADLYYLSRKLYKVIGSESIKIGFCRSAILRVADGEGVESVLDFLEMLIERHRREEEEEKGGEKKDES